MTPLISLEDLSTIDFNKNYLLVHVDENLNSTPFINTGYEILKELIFRLRDYLGTVQDTINDTGFNPLYFTPTEFNSLLKELEECFDSFESELNELGYTVYELNN